MKTIEIMNADNNTFSHKFDIKNTSKTFMLTIIKNNRENHVGNFKTETAAINWIERNITSYQKIARE